MRRCNETGCQNMNENSQIWAWDDAELAKLGGSCWEYTLLRDDQLSKVKGSIRGNTKIGPVLELAPRPLRDRDQNQILIWRLISFMDHDRKWTWTKYVTENVGWNTKKTQRWNWRQCKETCCESKTETNINADAIFFYSHDTTSHAKMDRRRTRRVRPKFFWSFEENDQIASSWSFCTARRRRSSRIQNLDTDVSFRIYVSALVKSNMAELFAKRRCSQEEISVLLGSLLCWDHLISSSKSRPLCWREQINPALQDNALLPSDFGEYIHHVGSSHDMHSIIQSGLIPRGKDRQTVFSTAVIPMSILLHKQRGHDGTKPGIEVYKQNWKNTPEHSVLGQFEGCSDEVIDVPSNKIQRDHPSQLFTSGV